MRDFIAIDFETANECASSVCSIGAVLVRGGEIIKTFYSLIKPEPDYFEAKGLRGYAQKYSKDYIL